MDQELRGVNQFNQRREIFTSTALHSLRHPTTVTSTHSHSHRNRRLPLPSPQAPGASSSMAFQRADPNPFKPRGMNILNIPNRPVMIRTMAPRRPVPRNENLAIVTIFPIPGNVLHFPVVEEVIRDFCADRRVRIREVQRCHLGQAFVRFWNDYDRDNFVVNSPHEFDGALFTFVRHNQGRNWRSVTFNHECLIMLLGLPEDYWADDCIDAVLGPVASVISWYTETTEINTVVVTRLLVKVRVVDLEDIPHFSVFSDAPGHQGHSWTVQCEILQHENLGHEAPEEELVPQLPEDGGPMLYDFFGLGQQVLAPILPNEDNNNWQQQGEQLQGNQQQQDFQEGGPQQQQLPGWGEWPPQQPIQQLQLNLAGPAAVVQDLNDLPMQDDPMEMVIDPAQGFEQEVVLQIAPPEQALPNNLPAELMLAQVGIEVQMPAQFQAMIPNEEVMMDLDELQQQIDQDLDDQNANVQQIQQENVQPDQALLGEEPLQNNELNEAVGNQEWLQPAFSLDQQNQMLQLQDLQEPTEDLAQQHQGMQMQEPQDPIYVLNTQASADQTNLDPVQSMNSILLPQQPLKNMQQPLEEQNEVLGQSNVSTEAVHQEQDGNEESMCQNVLVRAESGQDISVHENAQIGMVKTFFFNAPNVQNLVRQHHSAPIKSCLNLNVGLKERELVAVPKTWAPFLRALVEAPAQHDWAKSLLNAGLGSCLNLGSGSFSSLGHDELSPIPTEKMGEGAQTCLMLTDGPEIAKSIEEAVSEEMLEGQGSTPTKKRGRKAKSATPIVDSVVRRSNRVKANSQGFKSSCNKNCLACSAGIPTIPSVALRKIGVELCDMKEDQLDEITLMGKGKLEPVGKKARKVSDKKGKSADEGEQSKQNEDS